MITIIEAKFSHYSDSGVSVNTYLMKLAVAFMGRK